MGKPFFLLRRGPGRRSGGVGKRRACRWGLALRRDHPLRFLSAVSGVAGRTSCCGGTVVGVRPAGRGRPRGVTPLSWAMPAVLHGVGGTILQRVWEGRRGGRGKERLGKKDRTEGGEWRCHILHLMHTPFGKGMHETSWRHHATFSQITWRRGRIGRTRGRRIGGGRGGRPTAIATTRIARGQQAMLSIFVLTPTALTSFAVYHRGTATTTTSTTTTTRGRRRRATRGCTAVRRRHIGRPVAPFLGKGSTCWIFRKRRFQQAFWMGGAGVCVFFFSFPFSLLQRHPRPRHCCARVLAPMMGFVWRGWCVHRQQPMMVFWRCRKR